MKRNKKVVEDNQYDLGRQIGELMSAVKSLESKIDAVNEKIDRGFSDYETRLRVIETWKANLTGKIAAVSIAFSLIASIGTSYVKDWLHK